MKNKVSNVLITKAISAQNKAQVMLSDAVACAVKAAKMAEGTIAAASTRATVASASKALDHEIIAGEAMHKVDDASDS
jgi:hypothetical protein